MKKYQVLDIRKPLFDEPSVMTAASPKAAAEAVMGCKAKRDEFGYVVVTSTKPPIRSYVYSEEVRPQTHPKIGRQKDD